MKKTALLLTLLFVCPMSFAYIEEYTTSDNASLQGIGYSQEALKIIDTARMRTQGVEKDYVPFYSRQFYSKNPLVKWYQVAKRYFDPSQDEEIFGMREIYYNNTWFEVSPSYFEGSTPNDKYNRLHEKDIKRLEVAGKTIKGSGGVEPAVDENTPAGSDYDDGLIFEEGTVEDL